MPYFIKRYYANNRIGFPVPLQTVEPEVIEALATHWVECSEDEYWSAMAECEARVLADVEPTGHMWLSFPSKASTKETVIVWQVLSDQWGRGWILQKEYANKSARYRMIVYPQSVG